MNPIKLYIKHLAVSLLFLLALLAILFGSSGFIRSFLQGNEMYFKVAFLILIVVIVLVSFIFYLLLTFQTRFNLQIWNVTKSVALSRELFKKLYDNAPVPYIMLGKNAEIHEPNKATLRFFGVVREEIEGKNLFSYLGGESQNHSEILFQHYRNGSSIDRKELEMATKSGLVKSVLLSIFKMEGMEDSFDNTKNRGLAMVFDVTEQKLLDKAKTEFVSLASHQLRAPLATTKWYTEMLTSGDLGELNPKQKEYIDKLSTVNKDMVEMADVLLNVSRIEMGSLPVEVKTTNVEELTDGILVELFPDITEKKIQIEKKYDGLMQNIQIDPKLLRIVIQNIVSNAVKYTQAGGTVSIAFEESGKGRKIIVSDTGIGIPKEVQGRIFSKLFRADNARILSTSQGTGLGLYLVKSIIESMGGTISFVSEENKGSTFTVTF